jgi:hypothetical protein
MVIKTINFLLGIYFMILNLLQKDCPLFINWAAFLKMYLMASKYPLPTVPLGIQYHLTHD